MNLLKAQPRCQYCRGPCSLSSSSLWIIVIATQEQGPMPQRGGLRHSDEETPCIVGSHQLNAAVLDNLKPEH
jgi:hypothetical protein